MKETAGYFRPVRALITKALGRKVWDDPSFQEVWSEYLSRQTDVDRDRLVEISEDFDAGLVVGMWASRSALDLHRTERWWTGDTDDGEPPLAEVFEAVRATDNQIPSLKDLHAVLRDTGPTHAEYHLVHGCKSAQFRLFLRGSTIYIAGADGYPALVVSHIVV